MRAGGSEEVAVGEVDADQADIRRAHVDREAQGDVGRDDAVVQHIGVGEVGAVFRAEYEAVDVGARWRIDDDEVVGLEQAPDIVDADGRETLWTLQGIQRRTAAADHDRSTAVQVPEGCQRKHLGFRISAGCQFQSRPAFFSPFMNRLRSTQYFMCSPFSGSGGPPQHIWTAACASATKVPRPWFSSTHFLNAPHLSLSSISRSPLQVAAAFFAAASASAWISSGGGNVVPLATILLTAFWYPCLPMS